MGNNLQKFKDKLANTPDQPGVYIMENSAGSIIYIGKATSLKKRLSSYFQKTAHDLKVSILIDHIFDFEYVITDSEIEALLLESTLIKKHKPKYNVRLKDDKRYPYIAVTLSEDYPRVIITRRLIKNNDRYFGPYTDVKAARSIVSTINTIFKLRLCKKQLPLISNERPCLNLQIKKCSGLCSGKITKEEYMNIVNNAIKFLEGKVQPVIDELMILMAGYSEKHKYENAAQIRDIIFDIQKVSGTQKVYTPIGSDKDYIGIKIHNNEGVIILFEFRNGILLGRKISVFDNIELTDKEEMLKTFIIDYYKNMPPPSKIISQYRVNDEEVLEQYLTKMISRKVHISVPRASDDRGVMNMIEKNLEVIAADRAASQMLLNKREGLLELKNMLSLDNLPDIIECFDISNIQGLNAVASMVRFKGGSPEKSGYRRYRIRGYDSPNDPAMIHEAVSRRLQYLVNEEKGLPDLIVIDGGKSQLGRALEVKKALELNVTIISIAKRLEEIFTENNPESIKLDKASPALKIIQNIRDEAHRFAIEYHKKLRANEFKKSLIDDITGIGEKKKKLLLKQLGSVERVQSSSLEELNELPGLGSKTAKIIYDFFQNINSQPKNKN
jgi:excinuclease ABC subunit C